MSRLRPPAGAVALLLLMTGCHKHAKPGYTSSQPFPPAMEAPARHAEGASPARAPAPATSSQIKRNADVVEVGLASWYGPPYNNRKGADGTVYDQNAMTAAHKTLPMGSTVRVTNLANDESVVVRITDRGPFVPGRIIDLSLAAAKASGVYRAGVAKVRIEAYTPPVRPGADPRGRWCVQIGAFLAADDAIQLKNHLLRRYTTAKVIEFAGPTGYWVRINPAQADKAHATEIAASIHVPDAEPYLVRTD